MLRLASSFFLTYFAFDIELRLFAFSYDTYNIECVFWQGYLTAIAAVWLCFHLLLYRKGTS